MAEERGASKRRCVSTACIACRRRKSKVHTLVVDDIDLTLLTELSVMEIYQVVQPVPRFTIPLVCQFLLEYSSSL